MMSAENMKRYITLLGKVVISGTITLKTGMLIGGGSDFSAIGTVDKVVIRDPLKREPIIPGSTLKGKLRHLLERRYCWDNEEEVTELQSNLETENTEGKKAEEKQESFNQKYDAFMKNEPVVIKRLFGTSDKEMAIAARLQFSDCFIKKESLEQLKQLDTDLYLTEIKFENTINRVTGIANPRQFERVPAGTQFDLQIIYNIENIDEINEDMMTLCDAFDTLEYDYLGSSGTRGYGQLAIENRQTEIKAYKKSAEELIELKLNEILDGKSRD
ncbi:type III-A CRISPR-associated RAMP protein Csm3 [Eubacterium sp. 1001713B170207_170306_E7]|uniref:type III-A CRISPR-associated RAMP protein Csm3 n=1 Tax=Eubacterium sp. 1001713B170207_170306_E7 TaxID=2787097 RepID=UPI001FAE6CA3|nr:type III-A CRISPR-associated RAMP protein Csm3 [Eubacterium sp. 1001713B170207_170306_E7]